MHTLRWLLLSLALAAGTAPAGTLTPLITFNPPNPTSADTIVATLSLPTCGTTIVTIAANQITIATDLSGICGLPPPSTMKTLGALPAGTYQVQWLVAPNQTPSATASLVVLGAALAQTPALQPWAAGLLVLAVAVFAVCVLRRRDRRKQAPAGV